MASHLVPLLSRFSDVVRADKTASRLALVVLLIASFNAAELAYALGARSLGTLTHALHSAFESSVLLLSLWAIAATASSASSSSSSSSSAALQPESFAYPLESYTQRNEVLAAFTCAVFYLFFAMFMCGESAVHWLSAGAVAIASGGAASASTHATDFAGPVTTHHDHEHLHPVHLHLVRLAISLVGATLFARPGYVMRRAQQSLGCCGAGNSDQFSASSSISDAGFAAAVPTARELHVRALFVHFVCDALRCVLLPVASAMGDWDQQTVEFLVHQALALAFAVLNWDICASTALILLQTSPLHSRDALEKGLRELSTVDGVLEYRASHAWSAVPGELVGTVHVRVRQDADEMLVLTRSHQALGKWIARLTVQIERDAPVDWLLQR